MASKMENPALLAAATGLGNVHHGQAIDTPKLAPTLAEVQIIYVAKRLRLAPDIARLVAEHAFGRAAS